jgi:DNA-directed RNA polymerase subunit RPC12/RpoP
MNCKHNWIPIWERHPAYVYHYKCVRCGNIINAILKANT